MTYAVETATEPKKLETEFPVIPKEILDKCNQLWNEIYEIQNILFLASKSVESFSNSSTIQNYDNNDAILATLRHCVNALQEASNSLDTEIETPLSKLNRAVIQD